MKSRNLARNRRKLVLIPSPSLPLPQFSIH